MNERIDDLFVQARFAAGSEKQFNATMRDVYHKFAELIIRECAEIADEGCGSACFGNGIAGYQLLRHFGVEQ